ncbi:MAG: glucodextranase DOMON-like domain-containing protein [Pseudomonadota bacterium]
MNVSKNLFVSVASMLLSVSMSHAATVEFKDPKGDDFGNGTLIYPTDGVYKSGTFDLRKLQVKTSGDKVKFTTSVDRNLEDPWGMGSGFSLQMMFVFIDTTPNAGHTKGLPGLNIQFDEKDAWDKVVILSPQKISRVKAEIKTKAAAMSKDILVAEKTKGKGKKISGTISLADLGAGDPSKWGYQVVVQSNEGFPAKTDLLTRRVNEYEGQHRFGGGMDTDCDAHVVDILAGSGNGDKNEIDVQKSMLQYECKEEGKVGSLATLKMVRK